MNAHYPHDHHPLAHLIRQLRGTLKWLDKSGVHLDQDQVKALLDKVQALKLNKLVRDDRTVHLARYWSTLPYQISTRVEYDEASHLKSSSETISDIIGSDEPLAVNAFPAVIHNRSVVASISFESPPPTGIDCEGSYELMIPSPQLDKLRGHEADKLIVNIPSESTKSHHSESDIGFGFKAQTLPPPTDPIVPQASKEQLWATRSKETTVEPQANEQVNQQRRGEAFARLTAKKKPPIEPIKSNEKSLGNSTQEALIKVIQPHARQVGFEDDQLYGAICDQIWSCQACPRYQGGYMVGQGHYGADIMFVLSHPSESDFKNQRLLMSLEERQLFNNLLKAMSLSRLDIYLTSLLRCGTNTPQPHEWSQCQQHFMDELQLVRPKLIVALGYLSSVMLLGPQVPQGSWGRFHEIDVMPTLHPHDLLTGGNGLKRTFWNHMRIVMRKAGLNPK